MISLILERKSAVTLRKLGIKKMESTYPELCSVNVTLHEIIGIFGGLITWLIAFCVWMNKNYKINNGSWNFCIIGDGIHFKYKHSSTYTYFELHCPCVESERQNLVGKYSITSFKIKDKYFYVMYLYTYTGIHVCTSYSCGPIEVKIKTIVVIVFFHLRTCNSFEFYL